MDSPTQPTSPRGARRGLYWQDWFAAWAMLRCWAEPAEGVAAIEVEALGTPYVDDLILDSKGRRVYKQLKHTTRQLKRFTGADLFSEAGGEPALIGKLFKGWARVRVEPGLPVEIHLVTNAAPSEDARNRPISPVEFERKVLRPVRSGVWSCPDDLRGRFHEIQRLARAPDEATFLEFLGALRLEFNAPDEQELHRLVVALLQDRLRPRASAETEGAAWAEKVYDLATRYPATGRLSRDQIGRELRQIFHLPQRFEHRLALPDHHVPRSSFADTVLRQARELGSGYLLVLGQPGCGKTTLATWLANEHDDELLLRYHVFDPRQAAALQRQGRASALEFVGTILDVLRERFPAEAEPYVPTAETLSYAVTALGAELEKLAGGQQRLVVIDGIDHVVRSHLRHSSLFDALPQPAPQNVVFVLFGQPGWEYPSWLAGARSITVPPFTEEETRTHVCARLGWSEDDTAARTVVSILHTKSAGNPLSLFYNLATVETLGRSPGEVGAALENARFFGRNPHEDYQRLLTDLGCVLPRVQGSDSLRDDLLACLAVATTSVTEERLCAGFAEEDLKRREARDFLRGLRPVVVEREQGRFWLFHDDFRRYAEENTAGSSRLEAHRRLAQALALDWKGEELLAWAEHLWGAGEDRSLADLPERLMLPEWFQRAPRRAVVGMYKLALAAAFRLADDIRILRNALAAARAVEAAGLHWAPRDEETPEPGLKGWSFVVPPRGVDSSSLQRRAAALRAAAEGYREDPALAAEIAGRFRLSATELEGVDERDEREALEYVQALAHWCLRSGDLNGARRLCTEGSAVGSRSSAACSEELAIQKDQGILGAWAAALAGASEEIDWRLAEAATLHLTVARSAHAGVIARALAAVPVPAPETVRDAAVLLSLVDGTNRASVEHQEALVRWDDRATTEPAQYREFFFHGFVSTAAGEVRDLGLCRFPDRFSSRSQTGLSNSVVPRYAQLPWRLGSAAGLACRGEDLLRPQELEDVLSELLSEEIPASDGLQDFMRAQFARFYLPLVILAIQRRPALAEAARKAILPWASNSLDAPGDRTYGLLEATWLLAPAAWRERASTAFQMAEFPGTEAVERGQWFEYWATRAAERGVTPTDAFLARKSVAELGVPRKTDPAHLAVELLRRCGEASAAQPERVRRLIDLLIRLSAEPEGHRRAYHHLPKVLALALRLDPSLFWAEFLRSVDANEVAEPFGATPASVAVQWLCEEKSTTAAELFALWYWVAACPGGLDRDGHAVRAGRLIAQRLEGLTATTEAEQVRRWLSTLELPQPATSSDSNGSQAPSATVDPPASPRLVPDINQVDWKWFSSYWGENEYPVLRAYLEEGGEVAWQWVCGRLAEEFATSPLYHAYDATHVASGLTELRALPAAEAFEVAMQHLAEKVSFQPAPVPRRDAGHQRSRVEVFVNLLARGMDADDVETVTRSLRSLAMLARSPATVDPLEREMQARLLSSESRAVVHALLALREINALSDQARAQVAPLAEHPDAWCRWLACRILKVRPGWPGRRPLAPPAPPITAEPTPAESEVGAMLYADPTSARQIYLRKLAVVSGISEEELAPEFELESRSLGSAAERPRGRRHHRGPALTSHRMDEAAGRLACRLASVVPSPALPAVLSAVANQDPWLAVAEPLVNPPDGWVELCRCEKGPSDDRSEYLLRSVGLVDHRALVGPDRWPPASIAEVGCLLLPPEEPQEFAWVAECWPEMAAPRMKAGPVVPLSFLNAPFTQLRRDRFSLVPRWGHPRFRGLRFEVREVPQWVHPEEGPVVVAACGERVVDVTAADYPSVRWWAGWYASPSWLRGFVLPNTAMIRFWRLVWQDRQLGRPKGDEQVEYGLEEDPLREEGQPVGRRAG